MCGVFLLPCVCVRAFGFALPIFSQLLSWYQSHSGLLWEPCVDGWEALGGLLSAACFENPIEVCRECSEAKVDLLISVWRKSVLVVHVPKTPCERGMFKPEKSAHRSVRTRWSLPENVALRERDDMCCCALEERERDRSVYIDGWRDNCYSPSRIDRWKRCALLKEFD